MMGVCQGPSSDDQLGNIMVIRSWNMLNHLCASGIFSVLSFPCKTVESRLYTAKN